MTIKHQEKEPEKPRGIAGFDEGEEKVLRAPGETGSLPIFLFLFSTVFVARLGHGDFMALVSLSGIVTGSAIYMWQTTARNVSHTLVVGAIVAAFVLGNWVSATVVLTATLVGISYRKRGLVREDYLFFWLPCCFWVESLFYGGLVLALLFLFGGIEYGVQAMRYLPELVRNSVAMDIEQFRGANTLFPSEIVEQIIGWAEHRPLRYVALRVLPIQFLVTYLVVRWARIRGGLSHPFGSRLILFRIDTRWSLLLILGLALLLTGLPAAVDVALPILAVVGVAGFFAGVGCILHFLVRLRLQGRKGFAVGYLCCLIYMVIFMPHGLAVIGLIDIWYDVRKLTPKKGEI